MAVTLNEIINDPAIPAHLREQIAQATIDTVQQEATVERVTDSEVAELVGGGINLTHTHAAGTGWITVYDTETGEPREILQYMAAKTLMKRRDGVAAFSLTPTKPYKLGGVMCYLHPEHPQRERLRGLGLDSTKDCGFGSDRPPAAHLASEYDRDRHMEFKHSREWKVVMAAQEEARRMEQLDMQREQIDAMKSMAGAAIGRSEPVAAPPIFHCGREGCARFFDNEPGMKIHMSRDH